MNANQGIVIQSPSQVAKKRKSETGRGAEKKTAQKDNSPPVLDLPLFDICAEAAEFFGRAKDSFDPEWNVAEPFVLTGQGSGWFKEVVEIAEDKYNKFMVEFNGAFEISSFKHTLGRAQKRLADNLTFITPFLTGVKNAVADLDECSFPIGPEGVDEIKYNKLVGACSISAFCMGSASVSQPGFETGEARMVSERRTRTAAVIHS